MRQPQKTTLGGYEYTVTPLCTSDAVVTLTKFLKLVGPSLGGIKSLHDLVANGVDLGGLFATLLQMGDRDALELLRALLQGTRVSSGPGKSADLDNVFEEHFAGELFTLGELAVFAFKVNYAKTFSALAARVAAPSVAPAAA